MALTVDEIAEIINSMREENENNVQSVERVLTGINNKLDMMADDSEATDLIRVYISELKKSVDEKHSITVEKFDEIENMFNRFEKENSAVAKTSELRDLFNALGVNISNFSNDIAFQKSILDGVGNRLESISENSLSKDETVSLINGLSSDIAEINSNLDDSFKSINNKLSETSSAISSLDNSNELALIKNGLENISADLKVLPSSISHFEDIFNSLREIIVASSSDAAAGLVQKLGSLENSFENIVTESDFKGFKEDLADFVQKIIDNSAALNTELSYSTERIENILTTVKSLDFRDDFENIINRINDLKESFEEGARQNYSNLSGEIAGLAQNFDKSFAGLDEKRQEIYSSLKGGIDDVLKNLSSVLSIDYGDRLDEISGSIINISNEVLSLRNGISSDFQDDYGDLKAGLGDVISALQTVKGEIISQNDDIFVSSQHNIKQLESGINDIINELSGLKTLIADSSKIEPVQITDLLNKVCDDISLLINDARDNANSNYEAVKVYIEEITQTVNNLQSEFNTTAKQNADKILAGVYDVSTSVETLRDEFKQSAMSDLENSSKILDTVEKVSSKIDSVEQTLTGSSRLNFENLKDILDNLSQKLSEEMQKQQDFWVQSNSVGEQQKLESLKNLSKDIKSVETVLSSDIEVFEQNILENIFGIKDYIREINDTISTNHSDSQDKLTSKLESIEVLSHAFESSILSVQDEVKNVLDKITSLNFSDQSEEIKMQISNIISTSNFILSSINDINAKNAELSTLFSNILDASASKEDVGIILDKLEILEKQDYSYDLEQLSSKIDDLASMFENSSGSNYSGLCEKIDLLNEDIKRNNNSEVILSKIEEFFGLISSLKDIIENSSAENKEVMSAEIGKFEDMFPKIVTVEDFENFRSDLGEFIQKILDGASVLQVNTDTNREQIESILDRINSFDYSFEFENIAGRIDEIRTSFENNSKMNYENIVNEINSLKSQLEAAADDSDNLAKENFEKLNTDLSDLLLNIQFVRDLLSQNPSEILEKVSEELNLAKDEIREKLENDVNVSLDDLKLSLSDVINEINSLKDDFTQKNDTYTFNVSSGFDRLKLSMENILSAVNSFNDDLKSINRENAQNIFTNIEGISEKVDELKNEIHNFSQSYVDRIYDAVNLVSDKIDGLSENVSSEVINHLISLKEILVKFSNDMRVLHEDSVQQIKEDAQLQFNQLKIISENLEGFRAQINDAIESLKIYISELDANANNERSSNDNTLREKLLDLEAALSHGHEEYQERMEILQGKLSEFVQIVENSTSDTEAKIASSLEEITDLKGELSAISNVIKSVKISADEKYTESMSVIDTGIENIINNIKTVDASVVQNVETLLQDTLLPMDDRFSNILNTLDEIKSGDESGNTKILLESIKDKISGLKDEIGLVSTDISDALQHKTEEIIRAFEPVKTSIEELSGFELDKVINELKSQLETSFTNFSVDINGGLASASESVVRLEQAYRETYNKISTIEEAVCDKIEGNLELLNISLEKNTGIINHSIEEKFDEYLEDLKAHIDLMGNNHKDFESFDKMSLKLDKLDDIQSSIEEKGNSISLDLSALNESIKSYIQASVENNKDKELLEGLNNKVDILAMSGNTDEILSSLDDIAGDARERAASMISGIKGVDEKLTGVVQSESKVSEMLAALHDKVDILAADSNDFDISEEIDDIKDLIFEQRKYFEAASDEKAAAIDKYLRDLLLKLDNLDLEKNSEDIKDSIMNALVSLFDQVSFVEETEEIKDFVEEKTDEIKENLIKVQTQLHQIASSNDDFDYSYTLQDVESDIAKLRLAMNQISAGTDFEGLSEDIKRIVNSIEGLESSLTQDQIVDLKGDIEKLNEDILSISSRTNKLLLTSDESYKALNEGLNNFSSLVYRLEDRINELDKTQISQRLEKKLDNIQSMAVASANADKVFHQVMMYLGEWIDSATENISAITDKTSEISTVKEYIEELRGVIPDKARILDELQLRFDKQEERIDALEMKLDKILSTLEEKDDMVLNRKVDKIEKMLSGLGSNIEKLTSYVDEE